MEIVTGSEAVARAVELKLIVTRLGSPEAKEAFAAFLEKRAPDFSKLA